MDILFKNTPFLFKYILLPEFKRKSGLLDQVDVRCINFCMYIKYKRMWWRISKSPGLFISLLIYLFIYLGAFQVVLGRPGGPSSVFLANWADSSVLGFENMVLHMFWGAGEDLGNLSGAQRLLVATPRSAQGLQAISSSAQETMWYLGLNWVLSFMPKVQCHLHTWICLFRF